jgi:fructoselysine-6-P-deglycase FrlB-like protein
MLTIEQEIASQPEVWRRAAELAQTAAGPLPPSGARLALLGCGTSWFIAQSIAALREYGGHGESDAFAASEFPAARRYDWLLAISRSGTTTEVLRALDSARGSAPTVALSATAGSPVLDAVDHPLLFDFADEQAVVQTRFATAVLAFVRAWLGEDVERLASAAEHAASEQLPVGPGLHSHYVFLATGWAVGLAHEAALKLRESAGVWAESYPAMEYRHGPVSAATEATLVWALGDVDGGVLDAAAATGAEVRASEVDPLVELVSVQRMAVALARLRGRDPNAPLHLTRSVVLR